MRKINCKGFTLIEILLFLSIILVISILSFLLYKKSSEDYKINVSSKQLISIKNEIDNAPPNLDYVEAFSYILIKDKFSNDKFIKDNVLRNIWNGDINVENRGERAYSLIYSNVPKDSCIKFIAVSKKIYKSVKVESSDYIDSFSISDVSNYCSQQSTNNLNISFSTLSNVENNDITAKAEEEAKKKAEDEAKQKAEQEKNDAANLKKVKQFADNIIFQTPFDVVEKNNYTNNSFHFVVSGKPFFVQGTASVVKEFYISIVNAKDLNEINDLIEMTQNKNNLYNINVGDGHITATYITDSAASYYKKWYKKENFENYRK